jgi:hypothetical protein
MGQADLTVLRLIRNKTNAYLRVRIRSLPPAMCSWSKANAKTS